MKIRLATSEKPDGEAPYLASALNRSQLNSVLPCMRLTQISTLLCLTLYMPYTGLKLVVFYIACTLHKSQLFCLAFHAPYAGINLVVSYLAYSLHWFQPCCVLPFTRLTQVSILLSYPASVVVVSYLAQCTCLT